MYFDWIHPPSPNSSLRHGPALLSGEGWYSCHLFFLRQGLPPPSLLALELQVGVPHVAFLHRPFLWQTYNPLSHFLSPWIFFLIYFFGDWDLSNIRHIYTQPPSLPLTSFLFYFEFFFVPSCNTLHPHTFHSLQNCSYTFNSLHAHPLLIHSIQLLLITRLKWCFLCSPQRESVEILSTGHHYKAFFSCFP